MLTARRSTILTGSAAVCAALLTIVAPGVAQAAEETCAAADFSREVDAAGASLREFNASMAPELQARLRQLKTAKGWSDEDYQTLAQDYLFDARIAGYDRKANDLLMKLDELGSTGEQGAADCAKLNELKATGVELLAVMKAKSSYTLAKIDDEIAAGRGVVKPDADATTAERLPKADMRNAVVPPEDSAKTKAPDSKPKAAQSQPKRPSRTTAAAPKTAKPPVGNTAWKTVTEPSAQEKGPRIELSKPNNAGASGDLALNEPPPGDGQVVGLPPGALAGPDEGYTIEEIRDATRGFFGTISTNLATVIEHTFREWGQPTGYVLGKEGGGAFLAGLRYGKGTLYMRSGRRRSVYWHGPSLGYDFGAEGSRTLFLIYSLHEPEALFRSFTGVDGSAYLVGGVGVTLLKGGPVVLAPIRSGLGLRLGANIGYVRFTPEATWNPF